MKILGSYLKANLKVILILCISVISFVCIFILYNIPAEAALYGGLLSAVFILILSIHDFFKFYHKHAVLSELIKSISVSADGIPETDNLIEEDYTALISTLFNQKQYELSFSDREKSDMVDYYTMWAHQIKTPISAMNLILQNDDTEFGRELQAQLFKIEQYVEMVLAFLRTGNNSDFLIKKYSLDSIVKQSVRKYAKMFIRKKISLNLHPISAHVLTDEKWLCFVIEQLLSNAIKYTYAGTISIYILNEYTLVIEDTGIGIAPEDLPRICEKGFTGYNGRTDKTASGIGLYLSKQILSKLGHTIRFESVIGKGSKVFVEFSNDNFEVE